MWRVRSEITPNSPSGSQGYQGVRRDRCAGIAILSLVLGLACVFAPRTKVTVDQLEMDEQEYWGQSSLIINGNFQQITARRAPGYPLLLAAVRAVVGDRYLPVQILTTAFFSLVAPLTYLLVARELRSERAATLAGLGVAIWPIFLYYGSTIYSEAVALPFFVAFLLLTPSPGGSGHARLLRWAGAGMALGMCMLIRPMYLFYTPFCAWLALMRGQGGLGPVRRVTAFGLGCALAVLPWSFYITQREGSFIFLANSGGETLAGGMNPELLKIERDENGSRVFLTPRGRPYKVFPGKWLNARRIPGI